MYILFSLLKGGSIQNSMKCFRWNVTGCTNSSNGIFLSLKYFWWTKTANSKNGHFTSRGLWPKTCVIFWPKCVCPSVRLLVCPSVRLSLCLSVRLSVRPIFGQVAQTPGPRGQARTPQKGGFCQIYLLQGFWGKRVQSYLFGNRTMRWTKRWKRNFDFWPMAREISAGRRGWQGANQNFGISIFFLKGTSPKIMRWSLFVLCEFLIRCTTGPQGYPRSREG